VDGEGANGDSVNLRPRTPFAPIARFSTIALFGATAIIAQVLLLRECLIVVAGNELFIALFFGSWFAGIALGAAIGSVWRIRDERLAVWVPAFLALQVVLLPLLMISLRAVRSRWGWPAWELVPFFALLRLAIVHLCPFSFLTGLTFPMLCRLVGAGRDRSPQSIPSIPSISSIPPPANRTPATAIGLVYAVESLGSLAGGATATFVLAVYCEPLTGAWALGALTMANLAWFSLRAGGRSGRIATAASVALAAAFLTVVATPIRPAIAQWSGNLRHRAYGAGFEWLAQRYTPYQYLELARRGDQYSLLSNGQFISSFPDPYAIRQRVHLMMSQCEAARRVLVLGGGESGALTPLLLYPGVQIDYVEIDPSVLAMVRPYLEETERRALEDPRVHVFHEDARNFVRRGLAETDDTSRPLYDVIFCNTPDPSTAAMNRFYTQDFFRQARRLLGPTGVFVTSISSSANYFDPELLDYVGSVYEALTATFGHVLATPGSRAFLFAAAKDDLLTSDVERLIARYEQRGIADPGFSPLYFHTAFETDALQQINQTLRGSIGKVRPNTDSEPVTYLYYLRLWNRFSGNRSRRVFAGIERYDWRWVVWMCFGLLVFRLATARAWPMTSDRTAFRHAAAVLFATGTAGMVSSVVLLLLFQNLHGSLYRDVGLLVALFMAGLTAGSWLGNRLGREQKGALVGRLAAAALAFALFFLVLERISVGGSSAGLAGTLLGKRAFFYAAMILAGALTGMPFPLVGRLGVACGRDPGRTGGVLESLDHLGACLGAFATGIILVPIGGTIHTLLVFAIIEIACGISLALAVFALWPKRETKPTADQRR
jgi:spermidine synthase